jgi:hypothetical protein
MPVCVCECSCAHATQSHCATQIHLVIFSALVDCWSGHVCHRITYALTATTTLGQPRSLFDAALWREHMHCAAIQLAK